MINLRLMRITLLVCSISVLQGVRPASGFQAFVVPTRLRAQGHASSTHRQMFTGIVEEMGTIVSLEKRDDMTLWDGSTGKGTELIVKGNVVMEGAYLG
jgi:hypothetical protein